MNRSKRAQAKRANEGRRQKDRVRRDAEGHVHLELVRDPQTGGPRLALRSPVFEATWQNEMLTATANTAFGTLQNRPSVTRAVELAHELMTAASRMAEGFAARLPPGAVACHDGCAHCCYQVVAVTAPEALAIVAHLRKTLSATDLERVATKVAEAHERGRGLSAAERFSPEHPCPFLDAGRCSIYEVRPLSCRGMNSRDAEGCRTTLMDPAKRAEHHANVLGGYSFAEPIRATLAMSAGVQLCLAEVYRLDMHPLELTFAVHLLLSGSDMLPSRWIGGQMPFEAARAVDDAKTRKLAGLVANEE